jgi:hypothetical protein
MLRCCTDGLDQEYNFLTAAAASGGGGHGGTHASMVRVGLIYDDDDGVALCARVRACGAAQGPPH